ncbi:L-threonylcarbamoyladenylate synthase [Natronogracilivirga saccharolytica]|uniref:Threonylcarbamoyl-AMP synthase n=1 Tax=Natronogracilivirga saccharolytica TaxID=2812953 RepID=A0A8J7RH20_9BACT|nr:L-threonylcarbamoyladenylate synthase [Natronogracilivirga saccharolytica]MBP3191062.1 threonylcarbamoyl-AMP synthase [Natronogracilivirga saccharolytica]
MAEKIKLHPVTPHQKRIYSIADHIKNDDILLLPTDTQYALACLYSNKKGIERIRQIRQLKNDHLLTLICDSLTGISKFAKLGDNQFKVIKKLIPGPYTFVLPATKEVPKLLLNPRRQTIGFRVPDYPICQKLVDELGDPLIATTARHPDYEDGHGNGTTSRKELFRRFEKQIDLIVDNEQQLSNEPSTIVDMSDADPVVIRAGKGYDEFLSVCAVADLTPVEA